MHHANHFSDLHCVGRRSLSQVICNDEQIQRPRMGKILPDPPDEHLVPALCKGRHGIDILFRFVLDDQTWKCRKQLVYLRNSGLFLSSTFTLSECPPRTGMRTAVALSLSSGKARIFRLSRSNFISSRV